MPTKSCQKNMESTVGIIRFIKSRDNSKEGKSVAKRCVEKITKGLYDLIDKEFKTIFFDENVKFKDVSGFVKSFRFDVAMYFSRSFPIEDQFDDVWPDLLTAYESDRGKDEIYKKMLYNGHKKRFRIYNSEL